MGPLQFKKFDYGGFQINGKEYIDLYMGRDGHYAISHIDEVHQKMNV
jgi:hypothetical protein